MSIFFQIVNANVVHDGETKKSFHIYSDTVSITFSNGTFFSIEYYINFAKNRYGAITPRAAFTASFSVPPSPSKNPKLLPPFSQSASPSFRPLFFRFQFFRFRHFRRPHRYGWKCLSLRICSTIPVPRLIRMLIVCVCAGMIYIFPYFFIHTPKKNSKFFKIRALSTVAFLKFIWRPPKMAVGFPGFQTKNPRRYCGVFYFRGENDDHFRSKIGYPNVFASET